MYFVSKQVQFTNFSNMKKYTSRVTIKKKNLLKTENYQFEFYLQNDTFFMNFTIYIIYSKSIDVLILASNSVSYYASYF